MTYGSVAGARMDTVNGEIDERRHVHVCVCMYICIKCVSK